MEPESPHRAATKLTSSVGGLSWRQEAPHSAPTKLSLSHRAVAQSGQSAGLQNQWSGVRIPPALPVIYAREGAAGLGPPC